MSSSKNGGLKLGLRRASTTILLLIGIESNTIKSSWKNNNNSAANNNRRWKVKNDWKWFVMFYRMHSAHKLVQSNKWHFLCMIFIIQNNFLPLLLLLFHIKFKSWWTQNPFCMLFWWIMRNNDINNNNNQLVECELVFSTWMNEHITYINDLISFRVCWLIGYLT